MHIGPLPRRGGTHYGLTIPGDIRITSYKRKKEEYKNKYQAFKKKKRKK